MNADFKSLDMVSTWRTKALARNEWRTNMYLNLNKLSQVKEINEKAKKGLKKVNKESETDVKFPHCNKLCLYKTGLTNHIRLLP